MSGKATERGDAQKDAESKDTVPDAPESGDGNKDEEKEAPEETANGEGDSKKRKQIERTGRLVSFTT